jgi:ParB/RepB/Spo0J family partition protein
MAGKLAERVRNAGYNAGENLYALMADVSLLEEDPELSSVFKIREETLAEITESMRTYGYDRAEPVTVWKRDGRLVVVDGHTRARAAKAAGLTEIPVAAKEFDSVCDAVLYAFERQANRRNLTQGEIVKAAATLQKSKYGSGRGAERLAKKLGVAASTIYRAKKIHLGADEADLKAVQDGEATINSVYRKIKGREEKKIPFRPGGLFARIVSYLAAMRQAEAARMLIKEFAAPEDRERFREIFYKTLPDGGGEAENDV